MRIDKVIYERLDNMESDLRIIIASRAVPDGLVLGLKGVMLVLSSALKGVEPEEVPTGGDAA